jgi:hypothetical protein
MTTAAEEPQTTHETQRDKRWGTCASVAHWAFHCRQLWALLQACVTHMKTKFPQPSYMCYSRSSGPSGNSLNFHLFQTQQQLHARATGPKMDRSVLLIFLVLQGTSGTWRRCSLWLSGLLMSSENGCGEGILVSSWVGCVIHKKIMSGQFTTRS